MVALALYLLCGTGVGSEVGNGCAHDTRSAIGKQACGGMVHVRGAFHVCNVEKCGVGQGLRTWPQNEFHLGALAEALFGKCYSHLAAGVVANEADGIQFFVSRASRNENALATQATLAACKELLQLLNYALGFLHSSLAFQSGGKESGTGFHYGNTTLLQQTEVFLCGNVGIHVKVHGRSHEHRCFHTEVCGN